MFRRRSKSPPLPPPPLPGGKGGVGGSGGHQMPERRQRPLPNPASPSVSIKPKKPLPRPESEVSNPEYAPPANVLRKLEDLIDENFRDLKVQTQDRTTHECHRVILAAVSPHIHEQLQKQPAKSGEQHQLVIPDIDSETFRYLLRYVYGGEIWIPLDQVMDILDMSGKLQIQFLQEKCVLFLARSFNRLWKTSRYLDIPVEYLTRIVASDQLSIICEDDLFLALTQWVEHDLTNRKKHFSKLMSHVLFEMCTVEFLYHTVCDSELMVHPQCQQKLHKACFYYHYVASQPDSHVSKFKKRLYQECPTDEHMLVIRPEQEMNDTLNAMRAKQHYTDVRLKTEDGVVHCHRLILCKASPYYKAMFRSGMRETNDNEVTFEEIHKTHLDCLVHYMYTKHFTATAENVVEMLQYGHLLELTSIVMDCNRFMESHATPDTCLNYNRLSKLYNLPGLEVKSKRCLYGKFEEVLDSEDFLLLEPQELRELVKDDRITVKDENKLYDAVMRWAKFDEKKRSMYVSDILKFVNLVPVKPEKPEKPAAATAEDVADGATRPASAIYRKKNVNSQKSKSHMLSRASGSRPVTYCATGSSRRGLYQQHLIVPTCINGTCLYYLEATEKWQPYQVCESRQSSNNGSVYYAGNNSLVQMGGGVGMDEQWWLTTNLNEPWVRMPEMVKAIRYYSCAINEQWLYVVGGWTSNQHLMSVYGWSFESRKWTTLPDMLVALSNPIILTLNDKLYVLGGYKDTSFQQIVQVYDIMTKTWSYRREMPAPLSRQEASGLVYEDKLMVFTSNNCMTFNPYENDWTTQKYREPSRLSAPVVWKDRIVAHFSKKGTGSLKGQFNKTTSFLKYDTAKGEWSLDEEIADIKGYETHGACRSNSLLTASMPVI